MLISSRRLPILLRRHFRTTWNCFHPITSPNLAQSPPIVSTFRVFLPNAFVTCDKMTQYSNGSTNGKTIFLYTGNIMMDIARGSFMDASTGETNAEVFGIRGNG